MSFASKHNAKPNPFTYKTPDTHEYVKPSELVKQNGLEQTYKANAFYINKKGSYGDEPVIVTDDFIMNAPSHILDTVNDVLNDSESIHLVNDGQVWFKLYEYENKFGKQHSVTWVDA